MISNYCRKICNYLPNINLLVDFNHNCRNIVTIESSLHSNDIKRMCCYRASWKYINFVDHLSSVNDDDDSLLRTELKFQSETMHDHGGRILWRLCINFLLSYSYTSTWYFGGFVRQPSWTEAAWYEWVHWLALWWPANSVQTGFARSKLSRGSLIRVSSLAAALMAHQ